MKVLGINYIVITKNAIVKYYVPPYNLTVIENFEKSLQGYPVLFNNSQMTVYYFSSEPIVVLIKYIILVNISGPLNTTYKMLLMKEALDINFINYSNAIIIPKSYENSLLHYLNGAKIINISSNISVITVNNTAKTFVSGSLPNAYNVKLFSNLTSEYIPLIVRYNYYDIYKNYYNGNYSSLIIIPGYSNQTFLLLIKPSSLIAEIRFDFVPPAFYYGVVIYPIVTIILAIYLVLRNRIHLNAKMILMRLLHK